MSLFPELIALAASEAQIAAKRQDLIARLVSDNERLRADLRDRDASSALSGCSRTDGCGKGADATMNLQPSGTTAGCQRAAGDQTVRPGISTPASDCRSIGWQNPTHDPCPQGSGDEDAKGLGVAAAENRSRKRRLDREDGALLGSRFSEMETLKVRLGDIERSYVLHTGLLSCVPFFESRQRWASNAIELVDGVGLEDFEDVLFRLYRGYWPERMSPAAQVVLCDYFQSIPLRTEALRAVRAGRSPDDFVQFLGSQLPKLNACDVLVDVFKGQESTSFSESFVRKALGHPPAMASLKQVLQNRRVLGHSGADVLVLLSAFWEPKTKYDCWGKVIQNDIPFGRVLTIHELPDDIQKFGMCDWGRRNQPHGFQSRAVWPGFSELWDFVRCELDQPDVFESIAQLFKGLSLYQCQCKCGGSCTDRRQTSLAKLIRTDARILHNAFLDVLRAGPSLLDAESIESELFTSLLILGSHKHECFIMSEEDLLDVVRASPMWAGRLSMLVMKEWPAHALSPETWATLGKLAC